MRRVNKMLSVVVAAGMLLITAPSTLWAESAVPDPGNFFALTPEFDPNASGTKFAGTLTVAYVFAEDAACPGLRIDNMYVVLTLEQGNNIKPFNTDFTKTNTAAFCFSPESQQIQYVLDLIRNQVIPHFYGNCVPGSCPAFKVKSLSNFLSTGTGAVSTDIVLAVQ